MNPTATARSRRLEAALHETLGRDVPRDLEARILSRLANPPTAPHRASRWTAAAAVLLGCGIVLAVANARESDGAVPAQNPQPIVIGGADVGRAVAVIAAPAASDAAERLLSLAQRNNANIAIASGIEGRSDSDLTGMSLHTAVHAIARDVGANVAEFDGVWSVGGAIHGIRQRGDGRVTLRTDAISVRELFKQLHAHSGVSFIVGNDIPGRVIVDVVDVAWRDLAEHAARRLDFRIVSHGSVVAITKRDLPATPRVVLGYLDAPMAEIVDTCSKSARLNTVIDAQVLGNVTLHAPDARSIEVIRACAGCVGAIVEVGAIVRIRRPATPRRAFSTIADAMRIGIPLELAARNRPSMKVECDLQDQVAAFTHRAPSLDLARAAATTAGRRLHIDGNTYAIR